MIDWQDLSLFLFAIFNLVIFLKGYFETKTRKNAFGLTRPLFFLGIFVWADAVVFSLFWFLVSIITFCLKDVVLFWLIVSVFWVVRSLGETIYWLNQQFSSINRNPIETLPGKSIFQNDSVWFVHQIFWQCMTVISIIFSIYFARLWLINLA